MDENRRQRSASINFKKKSWDVLTILQGHRRYLQINSFLLYMCVCTGNTNTVVLHHSHERSCCWNGFGFQNSLSIFIVLPTSAGLVSFIEKCIHLIFIFLTLPSELLEVTCGRERTQLHYLKKLPILMTGLYMLDYVHFQALLQLLRYLTQSHNVFICFYWLKGKAYKTW